jgi:radical SAM protein with 4Fe4S-binding SPASM domain
MILQEKNLDEAEAFKAHWRDKVAAHDQVIVTRVYNWGKVQGAMRFEESQAANRVPCIALWSTLEVLADGNVYLCCVDVDGAVKLGNVADRSIAEMWRGPEIERVRRMHLSGARAQIPICDGCTVWTEQKHEPGPPVGGQ